jgi:hypothetical protein
MRRRLLMVLLAAGTAVILAPAATAVATPSSGPRAGSALAVAPRAGTARITVKPRIGNPHTHFVVSFRAPDATGSSGFLGRHYVLSAATSSQAQPGCVSTASLSLPDARARSLVRVTLRPQGPGSRWCTERFSGQIEEIEAPVCAKGRLCPAFVVLLGTVGRFSFRVTSSGGDGTPPVFAGLKRAFACTPGAQRPGQTTPFTLSWQAARDNRTPSAELVYDVYESTSPGGETFSKPSWITKPGATTFRTPGLPSHGSFYFVVRARDQAGNEDRNRVERHGLDPCL